MAHYLCRPAQYLLRPVCTLAFSGVARVHPQVREALGQTILRESQQELDAFPVLDLCAVNPGFEHQTLGVYQEMPLSAFDLLPAVVAALFSSYTCCLDRLAIHYRCAGLRVSLEAYPHSLAQSGVHPFPRSIQPPSSEIVVDGAPWWEVVWQKPPSTPAANEVEDGVKDLTQGVYSGPSRSFGSREMILEMCPLGVGNVG